MDYFALALLQPRGAQRFRRSSRSLAGSIEKAAVEFEPIGAFRYLLGVR
jgi:hypothetical protein